MNKGGITYGAPSGVAVSGVDIAHMVVEHQQAHHWQPHGAEGIIIAQDGPDICYVWIRSFVDNDYDYFMLCDVRTSIGPPGPPITETTDFLYIAALATGEVECEWQNKPINRFACTHEEHDDWFVDGMRWFAEQIEAHWQRSRRIPPCPGCNNPDHDRPGGPHGF